MANIRQVTASSKRIDIRGMVQEDHRIIQELFRRYRGTPADACEGIAQQILDRLASHFEREEKVLFHEIRKVGPRNQTLMEGAERELEEVRNMIHELQEGESDDDQSWDQLFEDMMETTRVHFATEERLLLPLLDHVDVEP